MMQNTQTFSELKELLFSLKGEWWLNGAAAGESLSIPVKEKDYPDMEYSWQSPVTSYL